jgi:GrpB-like predicted nucleotidyltransferase (UPF0157 family)/GNAT superfamily N-acetyltransferase
MLELQLATLEDAPVLFALLQAAYAEYEGKLDPPSGTFKESVASLAKKMTTGHATLASLDGQAVGCVFYEERLDSVYFGRLAVLPAYRRQGIARQLIEWVERCAVQRSKPRVTLGVRLALPGHIAYYERLGYQVVAYQCHPGYTSPTSADMQKEIGADPVRKIVVVPYDPAWPARYQQAATQLQVAFGTQLVAMHHMGSTAIPGIHAKPVIDILPVVQEITQVDALNPHLGALGYEARGEHGLPGRRYFVKRNGLVHQEHVHVYQIGHPEIERHLRFRDYLITHPTVAQQYSQLKEELARQFPDDSVRYTAGKSEFVQAIDDQAKIWQQTLAQSH